MTVAEPISSAAPTTYRPFAVDDIAAAHALSTQFAWPHRVDDWRFVLDAGTGFVAVSADRVIGTALCWEYGRQAGSVGMVIVEPGHQGQGIGRQLMDRLLEKLGNRLTLLHATPAGQPLYEKLGFRAIGLLHQHQGANFNPPPVVLLPGEQLRPLQTTDTPRVIELASRATGVDRSALLPPLLDIAQGIALERERDGALLGFSLFRRFGRGYAIGPVAVLADNAKNEPTLHRAQALIAHWLAAHPNTFIRVDTPEHPGLSAWLDGIGLPRVDTVVKMARNGTPVDDPSVRSYGIVNQALG
ncbi:GNAT family N-acetyltransferase [Paraburkholderia flava]|uniref:GNAT family N-acetyltransferase n=1 Tax=Paraburkholderia flava TaxID=2547393 RepID=UPI00105F5FE2|nr:GNAT family N-acetyltransferase [Paraburkholderia flava]